MHPWIWTLGRSVPVLPYAYTWWSWWIWQAGGTAPPPPQWPAVPASHETDHIFLTLSTCSQSKPQNNHKIFSVRLLHIFQRISVTTIIFNKQNHADSKYSTQATVHVTFSVAEPVHCWHARAESIFYHRLQYTLTFFWVKITMWEVMLSSLPLLVPPVTGCWVTGLRIAQTN